MKILSIFSDKNLSIRSNSSYFLFVSNLFFLALILFYYLPTKGAGFVFDTIEWFYDYETHTDFSFFSPPFDHTIRPVYHFILYHFYKLVGLSEGKWCILFCGLFFITCFLVNYFLVLDKVVDYFLEGNI